MSLKSFKPYTKSTRGTILVDKSELWKGKPYKPLTSVNNASKSTPVPDFSVKMLIDCPHLRLCGLQDILHCSAFVVSCCCW